MKDSLKEKSRPVWLVEKDLILKSDLKKILFTWLSVFMSLRMWLVVYSARTAIVFRSHIS